jgi:hypothetical protein
MLSAEAPTVTIAGLDGSESIRIAAPPPGDPAAAGPRRRVSRRAVVIVLASWLALAGVSLGIAAALDDDPAERTPLVANPPQGLPPLRLFLDRDPPKQVSDLPTAAAQAERLQELASIGNDPARWVELGTLAHRVGDLEFALAAYGRALTIEPGRLDATVGVQMVDGATGPEGLERATAELAALQERTPESQLVAFNAGMVAVYRGDRAAFSAAFARAAELGPTTRLGALARRFGQAAATPSGTP